MATETPKQLLDLIQRKLTRLRAALVLAVDESVKIKYEIEIEELEAHSRKLLDQHPTLRAARADQTGLASFPTAGKLLDFLRAADTDPESIGPLHRVNCNRGRPLGAFWDAFLLDEDLHQYQVYFITACDTQMPQQFTERLLLEYIVDEDPEYPSYRTRPDKRLLIENLPLKRNLAKSKEAFQSYIAERFDIKGSRNLDDFLTGEVANYEFDFVLLAFRTLEKDWKDFIPDYYRWIIDQFKLMAEGGPKFLLTFAHYSRDVHLADRFGDHHQKLISALDQLESEETISKHINRLKRVPVRDLEDWFLEIGLRNLTLRERAVAIIVEGMDEAEQQRFAREQTIDMTHIDLAQEIVYQHLTR